MLLDCPVGLGDGRAVRLGLDPQVCSAEPGEGDGVGGIREPEAELQVVGVRHRAQPYLPRSFSGQDTSLSRRRAEFDSPSGR